MNRSEARDKFRSSASRGADASSFIGLDEAKTKFREAAAAFDRTTGLDGIAHGLGRGLSLLAGVASLVKAQSWILPILSGIVPLGGKTINLIHGFLAPRRKIVRREKRRK
jgi:hypothetical protein